MKLNGLPTIIILAAMLLAMKWVFLVPIFQSPGEDFYADYVFSLYSQGRLIAGSAAPIAACSHPITRYLLQVTNGEAVKYRTFVKMPEGYGTKLFFSTLDKGAPDQHVPLNTNPLMIAVYPFGYFAVIALWLSLISHINHSLSFLFFGARLFSVILLGCGLSLSYLTMRELGLSPKQSNLLLAAIGFLPLVSFVGSYIQPDNLTFALVSACFFLALRWKNISLKSADSISTTSNKGIMASLSLVMALLLVTKYHFFCCVFIATVSMIIATAIRSKVSSRSLGTMLVTLLIPSIITGLIQLWVSWQCYLPAIDSKHWLWHWCKINTIFLDTHNFNGMAFISHIWAGLYNQFQNAYWLPGSTFITFWGKFGWLDTPLIIASVNTNNLLRKIIEGFGEIIILGTLASLFKITLILLRLLKRHHWRNALFITCSNPVINSYFLFVIFMFTFNVIVFPSFAEQGRQWFPMILGIFLTGAWFAPRLFSSRVLRGVSFFIITIGLLLYSLLGNYYALGCIADRYYLKDKENHVDLQTLKPSSIYASCAINDFDYIDPYPSFDRHLQRSSYSIVVPSHKDIYLTGWAVDLPASSPAAAVLLFVDNAKIYQAAYGFESPTAAAYLGNESYRYSGFGALIPTKELSEGQHHLTVKVVSKDGQILYPTNKQLKLIISQ